jgi:pyridinium-3,5-bisthiocarboxylic acid mononucleotide nickel chelatase
MSDVSREPERILYLEPFAGISGDMFLGALLDLGTRVDLLEDRLRLLPLGGCELMAAKCLKAGISATRFEVRLFPERHPHHEGGGHHHRSFGEIRDLIERSGLSPWVRERAVAAFGKLAVAEGRIHNRPPDQVQFHEVGALDSIVDLVGAMVAMEEYQPVTVMCAPVNVGQGALNCRHGRYPVPAPAALELLREVPVYSDGTDGELTTPTGAALLATLVQHFGPRPPMRVRAIGYGAGTREIPGVANVLRVTLGERTHPAEVPGDDEQIGVLEAAIDDMNPQLFGHLFDRAFSAGALDLYLTPVQMKKDRPGAELTVLCRPEDVGAMTRLLFEETSTLGVRHRLAWRKVLERRLETVETEYGPVRVKVGLLDGKRVNFAPEFDDCRRWALEKGVPLKRVLAAAAHCYLACGSGGEPD